MNDKENGSSFLVGFLLGAIAGIAVGFLYAPRSGKETRSMLKEKANDIKEKAGDMFSRAAREAEKE